MNIPSIIKFIIATIIFYLALVFNVFHITEKIFPESKDYTKIDTNRQQNDNNEDDEEYQENDEKNNNEKINTGEHFSAENIYEEKIQQICTQIPICEKILFNGIYNIYEKYIYLKNISKIIVFINENSIQKTPFEEVIQKIEINKNIGERRGYATRDSIVFNLGIVKSKKEFIGLLTHEIGHITDLGYIQGSHPEKDKNFTEFGNSVFSIDDSSIKYYKYSRETETIRKAEAKKKDFCSGYGMHDPFEDFAECFNLYINHNALFREITKNSNILKKKYNFIAGFFNGMYISSNLQSLKLVQENINRRPRDTTKITN